jgi:hypothetical protein
VAVLDTEVRCVSAGDVHGRGGRVDSSVEASHFDVRRATSPFDARVPVKAADWHTGTGPAQVLPETARRWDDRQTFRHCSNDGRASVPGRGWDYAQSSLLSRSAGRCCCLSDPRAGQP